MIIVLFMMATTSKGFVKRIYIKNKKKWLSPQHIKKHIKFTICLLYKLILVSLFYYLQELYIARKPSTRWRFGI